MLFCGCFMTSIAFWPVMATQGDSSLHSIFTRDGLVKEGKHENKARNFLLLVLCGSKSREATCNRDRERGPLLQPRLPQTALSSLQAHGGKFHLACVVFSWSVLRMCIIQISYLHDTGFTNSTAINAFHSAPVVRRVDCKVLRSFTWVLHK